MGDRPGHSGRDIFADGPLPAFEIGLRVSAALGLPNTAVLREDWTPEQFDQAIGTGGWIVAYVLAPGSDLRVKLSIDLIGRAVDCSRFPALARAHGLTLAWAAREEDPHDWHYHVASPDGAVTTRWLQFEDTELSYVVRMGPPTDVGDG